MARKQSTNATLDESAKRQVPAPPPLTDAQRAELLMFGERLKRVPWAPRFQEKQKGKLSNADSIDPDLFLARVGAAVGTTDTHAVNVLLGQGASTVGGDDLAAQCNTFAALVTGIQPRTELEGLLAVQMIGCHNLAMSTLRRATRTDRVDFLAMYGNLSATLLRTFTAQLEALARLRGQTIKQTVRVEHVHVEPGGQAVVGAVASRVADDGKR